MVKIELLENEGINFDVLKTIATECQNLESLTLLSEPYCEDPDCDPDPDPDCENHLRENECIDLFNSGILKNLKELDISNHYNCTTDGILKTSTDSLVNSLSWNSKIM